MKELPIAEASKVLKELEKPAIFYDYEVYVKKEIQMEGDPTSFEEAITTLAKFFPDGWNRHEKWQIPLGKMFRDGNRQGLAVRDRLTGKVHLP
jgi:hypothetical protein